MHLRPVWHRFQWLNRLTAQKDSLVAAFLALFCRFLAQAFLTFVDEPAAQASAARTSDQQAQLCPLQDIPSRSHGRPCSWPARSRARATVRDGARASEPPAQQLLDAQRGPLTRRPSRDRSSWSSTIWRWRATPCRRTRAHVQILDAEFLRLLQRWPRTHVQNDVFEFADCFIESAGVSQVFGMWQHRIVDEGRLRMLCP